MGLREARYECPSNLDQVFVYAWDRRLNKLEAGNTYSWLNIKPADFSINTAGKVVTIDILSPEEVSFWNETGGDIWDWALEYMTSVTVFTEVIVIFMYMNI